MSGYYWPGPALAATVFSLLAVVAVAGCGTSAPTGHASVTETAGVAAGNDRSAGGDNGGGGSGGSGGSGGVGSGGSASGGYPGRGVYTAPQLDRALLSQVGAARPAAASEAGRYGLLPEVQTSEQTLLGVTVRPAKCAGAAAAGFSLAPFAAAPAAIVTFQAGRDWISEVLVAVPAPLAVRAMSVTLPADCAHYQATVDGKRFSYAVRQAVVSGLADQARALNFQATGYAEVNVWSVAFRGAGLIGTVTMVGPDVSEPGVRRVAQEAYALARRSLPQV